MAMIQLFLGIHKKEENNEWGQQLTISLQKIAGIERVMTIGQNNPADLQLNLDFENNELSLNTIEKIIWETGGTIVATDVHFPREVTGINDAYGASAVSLPLTEQINNLKGVLGCSVSASGLVKVELAPAALNKDVIMAGILEILIKRKLK